MSGQASIEPLGTEKTQTLALDPADQPPRFRVLVVKVPKPTTTTKVL